MSGEKLPHKYGEVPHCSRRSHGHTKNVTHQKRDPFGYSTCIRHSHVPVDQPFKVSQIWWQADATIHGPTTPSERLVPTAQASICFINAGLVFALGCVESPLCVCFFWGGGGFQALFFWFFVFFWFSGLHNLAFGPVNPMGGSFDALDPGPRGVCGDGLRRSELAEPARLGCGWL